jgi:hypothetical protein
MRINGAKEEQMFWLAIFLYMAGAIIENEDGFLCQLHIL